MNDEVKLVNSVALAKLKGSTQEQQQVFDVLIDYLRRMARESHFTLPVQCPVVHSEKVMIMIEGVPLYECDMRPDCDIRETLWRRVLLYGTPGEPKIREVFVLRSMACMGVLLEQLTGVCPWSVVKSDITPRENSLVVYKFSGPEASREFYADITLSGDRKTITVDLR
jgi:hypothetical protein